MVFRRAEVSKGPGDLGLGTVTLLSFHLPFAQISAFCFSLPPHPYNTDAPPLPILHPATWAIKSIQ